MSAHIAVNSVTGTAGDDDLAGTDGPDRVYGLAGDDVIRGLAGTDRLWGAPGRDLLHGQFGDDYLSGGPGRDVANGGPGNDMTAGWADDDVLLGLDGYDRVIGHDGDDFGDGGLGNDRLDGGPGDDALFGRAGHDRLLGGDGNDRLYGDGPSLDQVATLTGTPSFWDVTPGWHAFALTEDVLVTLLPGTKEITLHDTKTGERIGSLEQPPGVPPFYLGTALAIAGDRILVGETRDVEEVTDKGRAHLYDTEGRLIATIENPDPAGSFFGTAVAAGTDVLAVAEPTRDPSGSGWGYDVHLYDPDAGAYRTGLEIFGGPGTQAYHLSLGADGATVAVGAVYREFDSFAGHGVVHLYDGRTGELRHTLEPPAGTDARNFGLDVAISGDRVLVGSPNEDGVGRAHLFDASSGELLKTIEHPAPEPNDEGFIYSYDGFGLTVALTGERVVIGNPQSGVGSLPSGGAVYVFDAEGENLLEVLTSPDQAGERGFGFGLAAAGRTVVAFSSQIVGAQPGPTRLYRIEPESTGGDDFLYAGAGDDLIDGGGGNDLLFGAEGNDTLDGGAGGDWISGGRGDDELTGGAGGDGFAFQGDWGRDEITDLAAGDRVFFRDAGVDGLAGFGLEEVGGDTVLSLGANALTLRGIGAADLQEDWFFFA